MNTATPAVTLVAGYFKNQSTPMRVMQIAGRLFKQGLQVRHYHMLSHTRECTESQEYTTAYRNDKPYTFTEEAGKAVVVTIHQAVDGSSPETVMILDAASGECIGYNYEGQMPVLVPGSNPEHAKRINKFFHREALTIAVQAQEPKVPTPVVRASNAPTAARMPRKPLHKAKPLTQRPVPSVDAELARAIKKLGPDRALDLLLRAARLAHKEVSQKR